MELEALEPEANREKAKLRLKDPSDITSVTKSGHTWSQTYSQAFQLPEPINFSYRACKIEFDFSVI